MRGHRTIWTDTMLERLQAEYPVSYNRDLARDLGVSHRTLIRKASELGIEKEPDFITKRLDEIERMAQRAAAKVPRPYMKGRHNNLKNEFKPGHKESAETRARRIAALKDAAYRDKVRLKYGLPQRTKWPIKNDL